MEIGENNKNRKHKECQVAWKWVDYTYFLQSSDFLSIFKKKYLIKHNQEKYVKNQNASGHKKIFEN